MTKNSSYPTAEDLLERHRATDSGARKGVGQTCTKCGESRPLSAFRRWHGTRKLVFKVCNACHPQKTIYEMSERELMTWMASQNTSPTLMKSALKAREDRIARDRAVQARAQKSDDWSRRREALWLPVLAQIAAEADRWRASMRNTTTPTPHNVAKGKFIMAYLPVLGELSQKIRRLMKLGDTNTPGASSERILPGVEKQTRMTNVVLDLVEDWPILISDSNLKHLAGLWSDCAVDWPRGRRVIEPAFIRGLAR